MRNKKFSILLTILFAALGVFIAPTGVSAQAILPISRGGTGNSSYILGSIPFFDGTKLAEDNANFFWDNINKRLGIGTSSPISTLDVSGNAKVSSLTSINDATINSINIGLGGGSVATNTSVGRLALLNTNSNSYANTAVGFEALNSQGTAGDSTAVGAYALASNTSGEGNTAIGSACMKENTTGSFNIAFGANALRLNTTGGSNVALGTLALQNNDNGSNNIAIGFSSGLYQADGSTILTSPENSIYIGRQTRGYDNNDSNSIVIGDTAIGAGANTAVIGNSSLGNVYFGSAAGLANTHVATIYSGSSSIPGCIVMGDTAGGVGYVTLNSGVLTVSTTKPSACQ